MKGTTVARTDLPQLKAAFDQELGERSWLTQDLVRATAADDLKPLDRDTVAKAIEGLRWPDRRTRARLERALGWGYGWMQLLRDGVDQGVTLDVLRASRPEPSKPAPVLRDPASITVAEATDAELQAEIDRRQRVSGTVATG